MWQENTYSVSTAATKFFSPRPSFLLLADKFAGGGLTLHGGMAVGSRTLLGSSSHSVFSNSSQSAVTSAKAFLDGFRDCPHSPKCIVAAIRLPGLSGLGLLRMLKADGNHIPVIMISGCTDFPMVVEAMRSVAINFSEEPINSTAFSASIREAIDCYIRQQREANHKAVLTKQINKLSARQREVFDRLVAGEHTKQIANRLNIGEKTVAKHRASVLEKLQVESVVELVRLVFCAGE